MWQSEHMVDYRDNVPGYRTIRVGPPGGREAAVADEQAWRARDAYPDLASVGGAGFGMAQELEQGGWQLLRDFMDPYPQDTRDTLDHHFRVLASEHPEGSDLHAEYMQAAERLEWEALDEMTVAGTRYRVIRAEQFVRTGPLGPEPPRPSDEDHAERTDGFVIDPVTGTTMSRGILLLEMLNGMLQAGSAPDDVREDLERAMYTHPGGVLLPAAFTIGVLTRGRWGSATTFMAATPQAARDTLVGHLRVSLPHQLDLSEEQRAKYNAAAEKVEDEHANEVAVGGQRFRITRVERLVRLGPDGPEGPRPSDPDPQPPVMVQNGGRPHEEPDDDEPVKLSESAQRLQRLFYEEEARLAARRARSANPGPPPQEPR